MKDFINFLIDQKSNILEVYHPGRRRVRCNRKNVRVVCHTINTNFYIYYSNEPSSIVPNIFFQDGLWKK